VARQQVNCNILQRALRLAPKLLSVSNEFVGARTAQSAQYRRDRRASIGCRDAQKVKLTAQVRTHRGRAPSIGQRGERRTQALQNSRIRVIGGCEVDHMPFLKNALLAGALLAAALLLGSCGGDYGNNQNGYCGNGNCIQGQVQFDGTLTGLASGTTIVLGDSSGVSTTLSSNGTFSYLTQLGHDTFAALIGVLVQPAGQNCTVANGTPESSGIVVVSISCAPLPTSPPPALALYAGSLGSGSADSTGLAASFFGPSALATDAAGNVYVADTNNSTIRKIAPGGVVTTLAGAAMVVGSSDGTGAAASFRYPGGIATDSAGNVYVADTYNNTVRKITPAGVVTTLAGTAGVSGGVDGTGAGASFSLPVGIVVNAAGTIYVSDFYDNTIRAITPAGVVTTLAGATGTVGSADGTGAAARFNGPQGIALDASGNLYVADSWNATIREVTPAGVVTTFAGTAGVTGAANGAATAATFSVPLDVAIDGSGDLYVADNGNSLIRKISAAGVVSSVIGTAGQNLFSAGLLPGSLQNPTSVALGGTSLFITTINGVAVVPNVP
jgi:sugar lactone lactonase YvrE